MNQDRKRNDSDDDDFDAGTRQTGYSVSSSAMHRNAQLRLLDDRFEKIEEEYNEDDEDEEDYLSGEELEERQDFDAILDEFLEKYEIVGRKMEEKLEGESSAAQLDAVRQQLLKTHIKEEVEENDGKPKKAKKTYQPSLERPMQKQRETWDVQSVISTYSNLENHPSLINDRGPSKRIRIDPKTGMPILVEVERKKKKEKKEEEAEEEEEEEEEEENYAPAENKGAARSKKESKEDKKARKQAVKDAKKVHTNLPLSYIKLTNKINRTEEKKRKVQRKLSRMKRIVKREFYNKRSKLKALLIFLNFFAYIFIRIKKKKHSCRTASLTAWKSSDKLPTY